MSTEQKTVTEEAAANAPRQITIVSTRGEKKKIAFEGTTWKELKPLIERAGFSLNNMKVVESINKHTLEHPDAAVPDGDMAIFLMPYKSKSGAQSRAELYATIKEFMERDGDLAKDYFNMGGSYTRKSSSDLADMIEDYKPGTKKRNKRAKAEAVVDTVNNALETVATGSADDRIDLMGEISKMSTEEKLNFLVALTLDLKDEITRLKNGGIAAIVTSLTEASKPAETEEQRIAREEAEAAEKARLEKEEADRLAKEEADRIAKEEQEARDKADREETERLEKEMQGLARGFDDVRL